MKEANTSTHFFESSCTVFSPGRVSFRILAEGGKIRYSGIVGGQLPACEAC